MKIHVEINREYIFDLEPEIERLKMCFKGEQLKRQMDILNCFIEGDLEKMEELYNSLPECKKRECSEREYVGLWMGSLAEMVEWRTGAFTYEHTMCLKNDVEIKKD